MATIKDWPASERPRERIFREGPATLTDAELIALLLRSGIHGKDAIMFSRDLVTQYQGLRGLLNADPEKLKTFRGLGLAKAASLLAVHEIVKRFLREEMTGKSVIREPQAVVDYLSAAMRDEKRELFKVLYLDKGNAVMGEETLFTGTVDQAAVHPREVIKAALEWHASALVFVHNHPSGRLDPSREDRELTKKLQSLCNEMSIQVLDHLIIGRSGYFSFREQGLL